jgi:glyceraldehyde 3-phosphate dehydrogenase
MVIAGKKVKTIMEKDDTKLPWKEFGVDVVIDCTGKYTERGLAQKHLTQGAKKVIVSAPGKECDATLVMGVNFNTYDKSRHHIISMASCTTGSMAPVMKVIDEAFGIKRGFMTTCHAYTMDQKILDASHKDLRRARAAALNIIPTSTGAAKAIGEVIPSLKGKMNGISLRVPVPDGSVTDISMELGKEVSVEQVNAALKAAAEGAMKGILEFSMEPLVSSDVIGNPNSAVVDGLSTMVLCGPDGKTGNMVKLLSWYDNEYGYSCRVVEMASKLV